MTLASNWLTFLALFVLVGAAGSRVLYSGLVISDVGSGAWFDAEKLAARAGMYAAGALIVLALFRLLAQAESFLDPGDFLSLGSVRSVLATSWGRGWWAQVGSACLALALVPVGVRAAVIGALLVSATLPLTGHALTAPAGPVIGVLLHGAHAFAGGLWLGTLAVMLVTWWRADPPERSGRRHGRLQRLIERYSPIALASAGILVLTGAAEAIGLVGSLSALTSSPYGRQLLFKLGAFAVLLAIGAYNWRLVRPGLGTRGASIRLARLVAVELVIAVLIIGLTASLTVLPAPGE